MFCSHCGKELKDGESVCPNCGAKIKKTAGNSAVMIAILVVIVAVAAVLIFRGSNKPNTGEEEVVLDSSGAEEEDESLTNPEESSETEEEESEEQPAEEETAAVEQEASADDKSSGIDYFDSNDLQIIPGNENDGWAAAYLDSVLTNDYYEDEGAKFSLVWVNDDDTPELLVDTQSGAGGAEIYTVKDGAVDCTDSSASFVYYAEKGNRVWTVGGHDTIYLNVFQIEDGKFVNIASGEDRYTFYPEEDENGEPLSDEEYYWNGVQVTEEEYNENYNDVYDGYNYTDLCDNYFTYKQIKLLLQQLVDMSADE